MDQPTFSALPARDNLRHPEIHVRKPRVADIDFARALYFQTMRGLIESEFGWDQRRQEKGFAEWFDLEQVGIIVADGRDVGWMQTRTDEREIFLGSLYVIPATTRNRNAYPAQVNCRR